MDIGSSSVRAALFDEAGKLLPATLVRRGHNFSATTHGGEEIDPDRTFREVTALIDDVLQKSTRVKGEITHVASCAFWHSLLGVDAKGRPTTKVLTWADTRSKKCTDVLRKRFDETEVHHRTGARFHSSFWPAKLAYIRNELPDVWRRTARWLSFSDYLLARLCGTATTSVSMASATGLFDQRKCIWDAELLRYLKLDTNQLPVTAESDFASFELNTIFKKRWPRLKNALWFPAVGDGAANNIGSGCVTKTRAALMIGTSGAMRVAYRGEPPEKLPPGLWSYRVDRKRVIVGGALSDGGNLYEWLKRTLRIDLPDASIAAEMARRGADTHGLTVMPFFFGERSTGYNEDARGSIIGLNSSHDAFDILQAAMESVAFRFADIFDQLNKVTRIREIVVSGGALAASPVWTQIIADVLGRDLLISNEPEASLRGTCLLALESIDETMQIRTPNEKKVKFHPACHVIYKSARRRHRR